MELLKQQIEALIFCSEQSISLEEIAASLKISFDWDVEDEEILKAIEELKEKYVSEEFSFELLEISEGFQFLTKKQYHAAVSALIQHKAKKKLSVSQMETLAIIAYRQPVSKGEVEHIRGVSCDYAVQKLLEKELIEIYGKSDGPGRPVLYGTSTSFMDYFGIKSVKDLPQLKDLHMVADENEIGQQSEGAFLENESNSSEDSTKRNEELTETEELEESVDSLEADSIEDAIESDEDENLLEIDVRDEENLDIPDRKSIFLENEMKKEIEEESPEKRDSDDFS
jgi:segregation and condensation protein B